MPTGAPQSELSQSELSQAGLSQADVRADARPDAEHRAGVSAQLKAELDAELDALPGRASVWFGRPGQAPAYVREPDATHYAASTMKVAVLAAAYRLADEGLLDLDEQVPVHDDFESATGDGTSYHATADYDSDPEPWALLGRSAGLRWLARRMIVRSSNLATNLVLERVGLPAVAAAWATAGARSSVVARGIQDYGAEQAGLSNLVTAADLAGLFTALYDGTLASAPACAQMLTVLLGQEVTQDVVRGLPPGTPVAHKNGWVEGIRHSAALVLPGDAPPYVLVTCVSADLDEDAGCAVVARVAAATWKVRADAGTSETGAASPVPAIDNSLLPNL
ncbi:serine hydrolase [Actinopolymorpha singaporensis]